MKTKLIYVLTCAPKATYIEQALMAVWSARYHNPDVHIVLLVDDKTDVLLTGKRGTILNYISEKIVVPFENEQLSPIYRSRWIKTQVRQMVDGDFLFVDCDTICQRPLNDIDNYDCEVGAVWESHLPIGEFCASLYKAAKDANEMIGVDMSKEQYYFSSGVLLVRDTEISHQLFKLWHTYWKEGNEKGLKIDQPSLAKANREVGHIIKQIPDTYNCILFTRPPFVREAYILHIAAYQNPSFLFSDKVLNYVRENGIENAWLQKMILNPCATMMPFDYNLKHSTFKEQIMWLKEMSEAWNGYGKWIDKTYEDFPMQSRLRDRVVNLLKNGYIEISMGIWMLERRVHIRKERVSNNICRR